ncbi:hypothetical protein D3C81_190870 [compost metagenome]
MADEIDDFDWGDDPFAGDIDFDSDFDGSSKQGFLRSAVTGFLSGVVEKTIGDTDARVDTLKMVLPGSWTSAFSIASDLNRRREQIITDLKKESHGAIEDLQYLAKRAGEKLQKIAPNKIGDRLVAFSQNDFSDWNTGDSNKKDAGPRMEGVDDDEVKALLNNEDANSILEREATIETGKSVVSMIAEAGGRQIGGLNTLNMSIGRTNQLLEQAVSYQRGMQLRNDTLKINLLARQYLTSAKYFKFQEAAQHRIVEELKKISVSTAKSDYEKTTHSQAMRKSIRESMFNTVKQQFGGIREYVTERFGKDARGEAVSGMGGLVGAIRMAAEMTEGNNMNLGSMVGNMAAGVFVSNLPRMAKSNKAKQYLEKFQKNYPELSQWASDAYKRIEDLGHVASYNLANAEGMVNTMSEFYRGGFSQDEDQTYDEYVDRLPEGKEALGKIEWSLLKAIKNGVNKGAGAILEDTYQSGGSEYNLAKRTLADGWEQQLWNKRDSRTLNEVIPEWLSHIHLSLEKLRTGDDSLKARSYDYVRGRLVSHEQQIADTYNRTFDKSTFRSQADAALRMVGQIDDDSKLSDKAKHELAMQLIDHSDKRKGFSPYSYMDLTKKGANEETAAEIRALIQRKFDIDDDQWTKFQEGSDDERALALTYLPSEEARKRAAGVVGDANYLAQFGQDMSNNLDTLRNSGYYNHMLQAGIIKNEHGRDKGNAELFRSVLREFVEDPNKKNVRDNPFDAAAPATVNGGPIGGAPSSPFGEQFSVTWDGLNKTLEQVRVGMEGLTKSLDRMPMASNAGLDLKPLVDTYTEQTAKTHDYLQNLVAMATTRNETLVKILERQPAEKKLNSAEEQATDAAKKGILDKLKATSFKDLFNKGVDKILDNEPLVLGGLLGGIAGLAIYNPKGAALVAGGFAAASLYGKLRNMAAARAAQDDQDLYEEGVDTPILEAWKLKRGDYYDLMSNRILDSWEGITGSVRDVTNNTIIGAKRLAGKLFTADNKEVFIKGLNKVREYMLKVWNWFDPVGRLKKAGEKISTRFYQMDVYIEGENEPVLLGNRFGKGQYFGKSDDGRLIPLKGWNEITGAVYDRQGNVLISEEDYDRGLRTSMGASITKINGAIKKAKDWGLELFGKVRDKAKPFAEQAWDKTRGQFKADYTPIVSSIDRIYNLLLKHWGYAVMPEGDGVPEGPNPFTPPPSEVTQPEPEPKAEEKPEEVPLAEQVKRRNRRKHPTLDPDQLAQKADGEKDTPFKPAVEEKPKTEKELLEEVSQVPENKPSEGPTLAEAMLSRHPHLAYAAKRHKDRAEELKKQHEEEVAKKPHEAATDDADRLNSLASMRNKAKDKKNEQVKDAIIAIGKNFGFGETKEEEKKPRKGIFGMLAGLLGGIGSGIMSIGQFFTSNFIWKGFSNLFSLGAIGIKWLPAIGTGIAALTKGVMTLVQSKSLGNAAGDFMDTIRGNEVDPETRDRRRKPSSGRRIAGGAGKVGLGLAVGAATDTLLDMGVVDPDSGMGTVMNGIGTAATVYGGLQIASGALGLMGIEMGVGGMVAAAGGGLLTAGGAAMTALAPLLFNPFTLGALAIGGIGYGIYKLATWNKGKQIELRMTQYGLSDPEGTLKDKILQAEAMLKDFVVIGNGRASLSKQAPIEKVLQLFMTTPDDKKELGNVFSWFNGRFKPVFMTYMACLDVVKMKSLEEYDQSSDQNVYQVAKQVHAALSSVVPYPYKVTAKIDKDNPILSEKMTIIRVNTLLEELKKYVNGKETGEGGQKNLFGVDTVKGQSADSLVKEEKALEAKLADDKTEWKDMGEKYTAQNRLKEVKGEISRLNQAYKAGTVVGDIYIKDMMPDGKALDMLTAIRVAAYGNDEDVPWRVEAVLKLERHCEALFASNGEGYDFTGNIGELFTRFKDAFRVSDDYAEDWCRWCRDRFIPVLTNYMIGVKQYRKGRPGAVWRTLSTTARYEIAKSLVATQVKITDKFIVPVWNVAASPFEGTRSPRKPEKVDRMLKLLGEAATEAKLKDPELEAGKTNAQTWAQTISPHKVGGGMTDKFANVQTPDQYKNRADTLAGGQYGTMGGSAGTTMDGQGTFKTPENKFGYQPITGDSDTSHLDMTGLQQNEGEDNGVTVPKQLAEQLIIREMLKQGFTDPRQIAEMLALTNYESGGYSKTTENMKYSSPEQLVKLFKEVTNMEQARQLIAAGPVAIANTVYGGGKGASIGNTEPGDGYKFRGRGFVQLTGRANYRKIGEQLGLDLESNPQLASTDPNVMAAVAVNFFKNSKLLQGISKDGDFGKAARGLNGGNALPGMDKRFSLYLSYLKQLQSGQLKADDSAITNDVGSQTATDMYGGSGGAPSGGSSTPSSAPAPGTIGSGNLPSLGGTANGGGGGAFMTPPPAGGAVNQYGGGYTGGTGASTDFITSGNTSTGSGLRLKSDEAVAGGPHHPGLQKLAEVIQQRVPGFRYFSALNDAYHKNKGSKGAHPKGLALDFTLTNGIQGSDQATAIVVGIMRSSGLSPAEFLVINEYRKSTALGTGGHVHAGFKSSEAAQKFLEAYGGNEAPNGQDTTGTAGGPVAPVQQSQPAPAEAPATPETVVPQVVPVSPAQRNMPPMNNQNYNPADPASEKGEPSGDVVNEPDRQYTGLPLPSKPNPKQPLPEGYERNKEIAAAGGETKALQDILGSVGSALADANGSGERNALILAEIHKQLVQLNQKKDQQLEASNTNGAVRMN